jgi:hypothetical protein
MKGVELIKKGERVAVREVDGEEVQLLFKLAPPAMR